MYDRENCRHELVALMRRSNQMATRFDGECLATEHVLRTIINDVSLPVTHVLRQQCDLADVRKALDGIFIAGDPMVTMGMLPLTPRLRSAFQSATELAAGKHVDIGHFLLGLLSVDCVATTILTTHGVTEKETLRLLERFDADYSQSEDLSALEIQMLFNRCIGVISEYGERSSAIDLSLQSIRQAKRWFMEHLMKQKP